MSRADQHCRSKQFDLFRDQNYMVQTPREMLLSRLREGCDRSRIDYDVLLQQCRDGRAQMHIVEDTAIAVTSLEAANDKTTCYVLVVAGTLEGMQALEAQVVLFAQGRDCSSIRAIGRPGFEKFYDTLVQGYKIIGQVYEKDLIMRNGAGD